MQLKIKPLVPYAIPPKYQTDGAACFDLHACVGIIIPGGKAATVSTGIAVEIPNGYVMLVYSRSGHAFRNNVRLGNCVGVIDSDYRGEVMVRLMNDSQELFVIEPGDRIAQAMILPVPKVEIVEVQDLTDTERGMGGFGSTGK